MSSAYREVLELARTSLRRLLLEAAHPDGEKLRNVEKALDSALASLALYHATTSLEMKQRLLGERYGSVLIDFFQSCARSQLLELDRLHARLLDATCADDSAHALVVAATCLQASLEAHARDVRRVLLAE